MDNSTINHFIRTCISEIEAKYAGTLSSPWRQREFKHFQVDLYRATGVRLSLSTLKRLWKQQFIQLPHISTLDALAQFLDYRNWHDFKAAHAVGPTGVESPRNLTRRTPLVLSMVVVASAITIILIANAAFSPSARPIRIHGDIHFDLDKTVAKGVPNTIMYHYDVRNVEADSFFIQQSWNKWQRRPIASSEGVLASIYYIPGFHRGKLIADDSIIAIRRVHILTDGWLPFARYDYKNPVPLYFEASLDEGSLSVPAQELDAKVKDWSKGWVLSYANISDFQASSDSFELGARLKLSEEAGDPCGYLEMRILTEEHIFYIPLTSKGCVAGLTVKVGEQVLDGRTEDLSGFGTNLFEWSDLKLLVRDREASIFLNGAEIRSMVFQEDFGDIKGIVFRFSGRGLVDHVILKNGNQEIVYEDGFESGEHSFIVDR